MKENEIDSRLEGSTLSAIKGKEWIRWSTERNQAADGYSGLHVQG